ncbi:hypothetical protein GCM10023197_19130 [Gordonia humi]
MIAGVGVLLVVAIAAAVVTGIRFWGKQAEEDARTSALAAARAYTITLFERDPKTVSDTINKSMAILTGTAKDEFQKNVVDYEMAELVRKDKIVATPTIQGAGVMENTRDTAKVLVFLNLSASRNTDTDNVQIDQSRIVYDMVRRDGRWLISVMDILTDDSLSSRVQQSDGAPPSNAVPIPSPSTPAPSTPAPSTPAPSTPAPAP